MNKTALGTPPLCVWCRTSPTSLLRSCEHALSRSPANRPSVLGQPEFTKGKIAYNRDQDGERPEGNEHFPDRETVAASPETAADRG